MRREVLSCNVFHSDCLSPVILPSYLLEADLPLSEPLSLFPDLAEGLLLRLDWITCDLADCLPWETEVDPLETEEEFPEEDLETAGREETPSFLELEVLDCTEEADRESCLPDETEEDPLETAGEFTDEDLETDDRDETPSVLGLEDLV